MTVDEFLTGGLGVINTHQDDEILWMLPALYYASIVSVTGKPIPDDNYRAIANYPSWLRGRLQIELGNANDADFLAFWQDVDARDAFYQDEIMRNWIRKRMKRSGLQNWMTHNPWGEYGHYHHRLVNRLVEEVAVELGLSVWWLGVYIPDDGGNPGDTYLDATITGDYILGDFNQSEFLPLRQAFLDADADPGKEYTTWTWHLPDTSFPEGTRKIVRRVNAGVVDDTDLAEITALKASIPEFGGPTP